MQSRATNVEAYLAELPEDRRELIATVRQLILQNLDSGFEEGMQYGMIGYYVPHSLYPQGYHSDPKQPLPFACLASQKNYCSLYMMTLSTGDSPLSRWYLDAWKKTGKKLDLGKSCLRFKKLDDLALDVLREAFQRMTAKKYIEFVEAALQAPREPRPTKKKVVKKTAKKPSAKKR